MVTWKLIVINPINPSSTPLDVIEGKTMADIERKWAEKTGNNFLSVKKLYTMWRRKSSYFFRLVKEDKEANIPEKWRIPFQEVNGCQSLICEDTATPLPVNE